jgi:16S rRNA processing protein RimM
MREAQHSFDVVLRGYDRSQVAETIERLEADFRIALADRDAAAALTNTRLYVPRGALPATADGEEFYYADLLGMAVEDQAGAVLGTVVGVEDFGAGDLLEIAPAGGGPTAWLPFSREAVPVVDLAGGRLVAVPPEGWNAPPQEEE